MTRAGRTLNHWWWTQFHPLVRIGWNVMRGSSPGDSRVGAALVAAGMLLGRQNRRRVLLYRHTMEPGESIRIRVLRGETVVADRAIES